MLYLREVNRTVAAVSQLSQFAVNSVGQVRVVLRDGGS